MSVYVNIKGRCADDGRYDYEFLKQCFLYDPGTGILTWKERPRDHFNTDNGWRCFNSREAGTVAGKVGKNGYSSLRLNQVARYVHRIALVLGTSQDIPPKTYIDHINGDKSDNRLCNLRLATRSQNNSNALRRVGRVFPKGICFDSSRQRYIAYIAAEGKKIQKRFDTLAEAETFLRGIRAQLHGEFANDGYAYA